MGKKPRCLEKSGAVFRSGTAVVPGIAQGKIIRAGGFDVPDGLPTDGVADALLEQRRIGDALDELIVWYGRRATAAGAERPRNSPRRRPIVRCHIHKKAGRCETPASL